MADNSTEVSPLVEDYNVGLHIGGLFAIMAASTLGGESPFAIEKQKRKKRKTQYISKTFFIQSEY